MKILNRKQLQEFHSEAYQAGAKDATINLVYAFHKFFNSEDIPKLGYDGCTTDTITFKNGNNEAHITWPMIHTGHTRQIKHLLERFYDNSND